jgi:hypothetical protein
LLTHGKKSSNNCPNYFGICAPKYPSTQGAGGDFGAVMQAKRLIESAPFDPVQAKATGEAFDQAWAIVALRVLPQADVDINVLRLRLADAILRNAERCGSDVNALINAALGLLLPRAEP